MSSKPDFDQMQCPMPILDHQQVLLAHGGGGKLTHQLLERVLFPAFANPLLKQQHDGAVFPLAGLPPGARLAFTTDSYVIHPLFFPGGNIGSLAVNGTVNDLAMCGARPLYLSCGLIIEEGFPIADLQKIVQTMRQCADEQGVMIVTGDTKVVERGKGDGLFINTSGIGVIKHDLPISPSQVRPADAILISGDLGRHGIAIMAKREGLEFESTIESDCAGLAAPVQALLAAGLEIHCMRDLTRGGLTSALVEIAAACEKQIHIEEARIPVREDVQGACEILGFDPMYVANEGRFAVFLPESQAEQALEILRGHPLTAGATKIGRVRDVKSKQVVMTSRIGVERIVDTLSGEQLPRIC